MVTEQVGGRARGRTQESCFPGACPGAAQLRHVNGWATAGHLFPLGRGELPRTEPTRSVLCPAAPSNGLVRLQQASEMPAGLQCLTPASLCWALGVVDGCDWVCSAGDEAFAPASPRPGCAWGLSGASTDPRPLSAPETDPEPAGQFPGNRDAAHVPQARDKL